MRTPVPPDPAEIQPHYVYRLHLGPKLFGLGPTQLAEAIATGDIPTPIKLTDSGRARGWLGAQILAWQKERLEKAPKQKNGVR